MRSAGSFWDSPSEHGRARCVVLINITLQEFYTKFGPTPKNTPPHRVDDRTHCGSYCKCTCLNLGAFHFQCFQEEALIAGWALPGPSGGTVGRQTNPAPLAPLDVSAWRVFSSASFQREFRARSMPGSATDSSFLPCAATLCFPLHRGFKFRIEFLVGRRLRRQWAGLAMAGVAWPRGGPPFLLRGRHWRAQHADR